MSGLAAIRNGEIRQDCGFIAMPKAAAPNSSVSRNQNGGIFYENQIRILGRNSDGGRGF
nr:MAG TPA: hypothetical protein [Caudoviricetes sp.]DAV67930.1 MAG TPA: hypothetical protein [Caudoviricetes sp.]